MTGILRTVMVFCTLYLCVMNASWADDSNRLKMAKQLITSSYMIRFHSYLAEDAANYANLLNPEVEQKKAEQALAELKNGNQGPEVEAAWQDFERAKVEFEKLWQEMQYPNWYAWQDLDAAHKQLISIVHGIGKNGKYFEDNLALMDLMEYYLYRSTPVVSANSTPRGNDYDWFAHVDSFDQRIQRLQDSGLLNRKDAVRWRYIKPLFSTKDLSFSPMIVMRHGGALSRVFVEG